MTGYCYSIAANHLSSCRVEPGRCRLVGDDMKSGQYPRPQTCHLLYARREHPNDQNLAHESGTGEETENPPGNIVQDSAVLGKILGLFSRTQGRESTAVVALGSGTLACKRLEDTRDERKAQRPLVTAHIYAAPASRPVTESIACRALSRSPACRL